MSYSSISPVSLSSRVSNTSEALFEVSLTPPNRATADASREADKSEPSKLRIDVTSEGNDRQFNFAHALASPSVRPAPETPVSRLYAERAATLEDENKALQREVGSLSEQVTTLQATLTKTMQVADASYLRVALPGLRLHCPVSQAQPLSSGKADAADGFSYLVQFRHKHSATLLCACRHPTKPDKMVFWLRHATYKVDAESATIKLTPVDQSVYVRRFTGGWETGSPPDAWNSYFSCRSKLLDANVEAVMGADNGSAEWLFPQSLAIGYTRSASNGLHFGAWSTDATYDDWSNHKYKFLTGYPHGTHRVKITGLTG